jgi:phage-related minor tail protein
MKTLQETIKELGIVLGEKILPVITPIIQKITEWVTKFSELDGSTQTIILAITGVVAVIGPLLVVIGSLISAAGVVAGAIGAISLPIVAIVAGIAGLIAIGVLLYKNWDEVKASCQLTETPTTILT